MVIRILPHVIPIHSDTEVVVCTTNSIGVMGKGIAKYFREQVRGLFYRYRKHCEAHDPKDMVPYVFDRGDGRYVYCLHTKHQWWLPSKMEYIEKGLEAFVVWCQEKQIKSVGIPPLGCGNGGLKFKDVEPVMRKYLEPLEAEVTIYNP